MQLALKLGFRYIWIDSLCIVQDDAEDWEIQASLMSEIYQDAVLTLAATSSSGDNEGCCTKDAHHIPTLEVTLPEDIGACHIAVRKPLNHFNFQTVDGLLNHFPLLTRGWVLDPLYIVFAVSKNNAHETAHGLSSRSFKRLL